MDKLTAKASIAIQKPVSEIFEAIINPASIQNYFISKGSGRLEKGKEVFWEFPEFEGSFPIKVIELIPEELVIFEWDPNSIVEIRLRSIAENDTVVTVQETGYQMDEAGIKWLVGQTEGWANFLACMKAWIEFKIPLRKGAFNYLYSN